MWELRALCCLELFLDSEFYADHQCFHYIYSFHRELFSSTKSLLSLSLSDAAIKSNLKGGDLVKKRAMCARGQWSSFICVLALASVLNKRIYCHYPDFGEVKLKSLFNHCVLPRSFYTSPSHFVASDIILDLLFCQLSSEVKPFKTDHFVPLIPHIKKSKKRPLSTLNNVSA